MVAVDFSGRSVLVTGGTRGLGKAIGLEFARANATVFLTHYWGSVDEAEVEAEFERAGLARPKIVRADVSDSEQTRNLMSIIGESGQPLDAIVSNVAFGKVVHELSDLKRRALELSLGYSAWPVVDLIQASDQVLRRFPRYLIGISSDGPDVCHLGYDLAGASKAVLETLCRYLAHRLKPSGVRVNVVRPGFLDTASSRATFGSESIDSIKARMPGLFMEPQRVATACLALCSGLMDAITGQVIVVDEGGSLVSHFSLLQDALLATQEGKP